MARWDWMRIAGASGLLAVILAVAGVAFFQFPGLGDDAATIRADYQGDRELAITMSILHGLALMALLVFVGTVSTVIRHAEGDGALFGTIAYGGGVLAAGAMLAGTGLGFMLAFRVETITDDSTLLALADGQKIALATMVFPMTIFMAAASAGILRTHVVDAWVGWAGMVAAVLWATGLPQLYVTDGFWSFDGAWGYLTAIGMGLWVALLSVVLMIPRLGHHEQPAVHPMAHA